MLVLTRRPGQRIVIDDNIIITAVSLSDGQVRIGIEAPRNISIVREELIGRDFKNKIQPKEEAA